MNKRKFGEDPIDSFKASLYMESKLETRERNRIMAMRARMHEEVLLNGLQDQVAFYDLSRVEEGLAWSVELHNGDVIQVIDKGAGKDPELRHQRCTPPKETVSAE